MTDTPTLLMAWDGESFKPVGPAGRLRADALYTVGERYMVEAHEMRNMAAHRAFFAAVNEGWANLPEEMAARFPSAEHLRKYALVKTGFANEAVTVCATNAEATRLAAYIRRLDGFAVISLQGNVVTSWTAKSQATRGPHAMTKDEFNASKTAVLDYIASLIGHTGESLQQNTGAAA